MKINEAINISKKVASKLKELEGVKAVSIYGSIAKGIFDKYSDIDIMCFCEKIPNEGKRIEKDIELEGFVKRMETKYPLGTPGRVRLVAQMMFATYYLLDPEIHKITEAGKNIRCES